MEEVALGDSLALVGVLSRCIFAIVGFCDGDVVVVTGDGLIRPQPCHRSSFEVP